MKENLPVPQKNKFMTKLKKMLFIVLSSVGLAGNMTTSVEANEVDITKVHELDEQKNSFKESLKVMSESEQIADQLIKNRQEKGLGEYSQITGEANRVREQLVDLFEGINKNFDRNAKQKGIQAIDKEDYKKSLINLLENLDDIIFVDDLDGDNEYANYLKNKASAGAFYQRKNNVIVLQPQYLTFAGKRISDKKYYGGQHYTFVHELQHAAQFSAKENASYKENIYIEKSENDELSLKKVSEDDFFLYSSYLDSLLREGHSNNQAEYVRDFNVEKLDLISESNYHVPTIVYNKLAYLVGEKTMDSYMKNPTTYLCDFLTNQLDDKYGEGTGVEMYSLINNLTLCWNSNYESVKVESMKELEYRYKVAKNKEKSNQELVDAWKSNHSESWDRNFEKSLSQANQVNQSYQSAIEDIFAVMENKENSETEQKKLSKAIQKVCDQQLKKLEKLSLKCIKQDIEKISNKEEVLEYVQLWDYYRNRCAISKDLSYGLDRGWSDSMKDDNFKLCLNLQHNLYKKCSKFDSLNIKDEDIFNLLIESNLFDVSNARVKQDGNKVTISDQYVINKGYIESFGSYVDVSKENVGNVAKGKKFFNNREKDLEQDYSSR